MDEEFYEDDRYFDIMVLVDEAIAALKYGDSLEEVFRLLKKIEDV